MSYQILCAIPLKRLNWIRARSELTQKTAVSIQEYKKNKRAGPQKDALGPLIEAQETGSEVLSSEDLVAAGLVLINGGSRPIVKYLMTN
jgi:hypothetical protein